MNYIAHGWPSLFCELLETHYRSRLVHGHRTIIPNVTWRVLLEELCSVYIGLSRMKIVISSLFWWPNLDRDIENIVSHCLQCQEVSRHPVQHCWIYFNVFILVMPSSKGPNTWHWLTLTLSRGGS